MGKTIRVTGFVLDAHVCEEEAGDDGYCRPPTHAMLARGLDQPRPALLVVGDAGRIGALGQDEAITLEGTLRQWSRDKVFVRTEGLLELPPSPPPPVVDLDPSDEP